MTSTIGFEMPSQNVFEQQMEVLKRDMREMRAAVTDMAKAIGKLAVLEERNLATNQTIERIVDRMEKSETKVSRIELDQVKFKNQIDGVSKMLKWMCVAFGGGVIYRGARRGRGRGPRRAGGGPGRGAS